MARLTPPPWSPTYTNIIPQSSIFLRIPTPPTQLHSRFAIFHAIPSRNVDQDDIETVFPRRKRGRRRMRKRSESRERRWWSDDDDDDDQLDGDLEGGILQQLLDDLFILKVFRSYGLFLPVILLSLLLATGPKAFLMGSGVPFGLSLLVLAFNKLLPWQEFSANPKPKRRPKRSRFSRKGDVFMKGKDRRARENDQSMVNGFGGWDELVTENETERTEMPVSMKARFEMMTEKKVESSIEEREVPLMLRLLVGLFPFLGSWTNLLH